MTKNNPTYLVKKWLGLAYCCLFCCISSGLMAQTPLSLDSCLRRATLHNKVIKQAQLEVDKAQQTKSQTLSYYFPQISGYAMGYHALQPVLEIGIDDIGNADARKLLNFLYNQLGPVLGIDNHLSMFQYGYQVGVSALQPIYMGGKIVTGNQLAQVGIQAAQLQSKVTTRDVLQEVEESYWLVAGLTSKQATLQSSLALLDTLQNIVQTAVKAGLALEKDLLQVELKRSEMNRTHIQLTNGILLAKRALCLSIGMDYADSITVEQPTLLTDIPMQDTLAHNSPEEQLLALQVKAAQLQRRMALADALPHIALGASYGYGNYQANFLENGFGSDTGNGSLFVSVSVPLTAWWETSHKLRKQALAIEQAQLQQAHTDELLQMRTTQALNGMNEALLMADEYEKAVEIAQRNHQLTLASYQAGSSTIAELLEAQTTLLKAQNDLTDAIISYRVQARKYLYYQYNP